VNIELTRRAADVTAATSPRVFVRADELARVGAGPAGLRVDSAAPIAFPFEACQRLTAVGDVAASFRCLLGGEVAADEA